MSSLFALLAALVLGLAVPHGAGNHRTVAPATPGAGSSPGAAAPTHRVVVRPMDVFGGPGM
ncbi:MAG: hypothetical protein QOI11_3605 [Candidatus Eremiobacteraeota bacterium]|nr:hypothetical protein [Candidatus Eremiobacteraeota bacterium]